jgi:hypothetical protein
MVNINESMKLSLVLLSESMPEPHETKVNKAAMKEEQ